MKEEESERESDTTNRERLLEAMKQFAMHDKVTGFINTTLKCVKCGVKVQNNFSEPSGNRKMPCRVFYLTLHYKTWSGIRGQKVNI
jgi:hypothetical protein